MLWRIVAGVAAFLLTNLIVARLQESWRYGGGGGRSHAAAQGVPLLESTSSNNGFKNGGQEPDFRNYILFYTVTFVILPMILWLAWRPSQAPPPGFIYTQLPGKPEPGVMWPPATGWEDVTERYSGLFFRALTTQSERGSLPEGHGSMDFEVDRVQEASCPHLSTVQSKCNSSPCSGNRYFQAASHPGRVDVLPNNHPSDPVIVGWHQSQCLYHCLGLAFTVTNHEVRPKNIAVRLWEKRRE